MKTTSNKGIDYGNGRTNVSQSGIRFGVIPQYDVIQAWSDSSEAEYPEQEEGESNDCECECEPIAFKLDDGEYKAIQSGDDSDIFVLESPYFTYAQFCSPCAPGACYLTNSLEERDENNRAYCFGHDWFESGVAPYPVYSVTTGELVQPSNI